jgi:hypothetical protein
MFYAVRIPGSFPLIGTVIVDKDGKYETVFTLNDSDDAHIIGKTLSQTIYWVNGDKFFCT